MRAYSASSEEALRARNLLRDWAGEGFLTQAQYQAMEPDTACDLRRTSIFLRVVFFFFTLIVVGAGMGLFALVFLSRPSEATTGVLLLIFAAISYAAAELAVSQAKLYRYGIEEALVVFAVGFLCVGMELAFFSGGPYSARHPMQSVVPAAGIIASLLIWRRFGLHYAFLGAMILVPWLAYEWTSCDVAQHLIIVTFYAVGLIAVAARRGIGSTCLEIGHSVAEALLWSGIYVAINLQLSSFDLLGVWRPVLPGNSAIPRPFYWSTWVLIWCLPPTILARGARCKDRFVIAAGAIVALLTLVTNKPYLGWRRQTWDPMFLGVFLAGLALFLRRWLSRGPDGIRHGFTAGRLSGKGKQWMNVASTAFGMAHSPAPNPAQASSTVQFGGGDSGGGGASSDF